jgi:dTDP-glucose 4,6-dehydratase
MLDLRLRRPGTGLAAAEWVVLSRDPDAFRAANPQFAKVDGVKWIAGDVRNFAFPEGRFDAIIHAATSAVTTISDEEQTSVILDGTRHVAEFAERCGCRTVLFTSSGAVYGPGTAPVGETASCRPATAYGKGKLAAEKLLLESGLDVKIARCFAFTGPYLNKDIHYAIGNFMRDCLAGNDIVINGDGTPRRSYLYADDLVEWLFAILERGEAGRPYNVGSDAAVSILELAETVRRVLGAKNDIVVKGAPQGGPPSVYVPEIGRAREELGLDVRIGLEEAIRRSV